MDAHRSLICGDMQAERMQVLRQWFGQALALVRPCVHPTHTSIIPDAFEDFCPEHLKHAVVCGSESQLIGTTLNGAGIKQRLYSQQVLANMTAALAVHTLYPRWERRLAHSYSGAVSDNLFTHSIHRKARLLGRHHGAPGTRHLKIPSFAKANVGIHIPTIATGIVPNIVQIVRRYVIPALQACYSRQHRG